MRDALRAVGVVLGVPLVIGGAVGLLRGRINTAEIVAGSVGIVFLVLVLITPPGKPAEPPAEDEW